MSTPKPAKKQKLGPSVDVVIETGSSCAFGLFPSSAPPAETPFVQYKSTTSSSSTALAAETMSMEWDSRNQMGIEIGGEGEICGEGPGYAVQYMLGVRDPKTNILTLHSAPLHSFSTSSKLLKSAPNAVTATTNQIQRAVLGTTFGTKKAIRSINAAVRNKMDHESYGIGKDVQTLLQASIAGSSKSLPSASIIEAAANLKRPIPPPNFEAQQPKEAYNMKDVVTDMELGTIDLEPYLTATSIGERIKLLPFRKSEFIKDRLRNLLPGGEEDELPVLNAKSEKRLRLLIHLSYLFAFRNATDGGRDALDRNRLNERLNVPAAPIMEGLLERYTERLRLGNGEDEQRISDAMKIKLSSYLLVVVLKIDSFTTPVSTLAKDLGIGEKRVAELFRSLGCTLVAPSTPECAAMIESKQVRNLTEARANKRAVLRVPLTFPKETRGAPKR